MKSIVIGLLGILIISSSAQAQTCKDVMKHKLAEERNMLIATQVIGVPALVIGSAFGAAWAGGFAVNYIVQSHKPRNLVKIIDQAQVCSGRKIGNLYDKYVRITDDSISMADFCLKITQGNKDQSLCPESTKFRTPSKKDIIDFIKD